MMQDTSSYKIMIRGDIEMITDWEIENAKSWTERYYFVMSDALSELDSTNFARIMAKSIVKVFPGSVLEEIKKEIVEL